MQTMEECRLRASDALDLSWLVTMGCDRERLTREARFWRREADRLGPQRAEARRPKVLSVLFRHFQTLAQAPRLQSN